MNTVFRTAACFNICLAAAVSIAAAADDPQRWESAIEKFEQQDEKSPPERGGVLFVGSSSIRMWDLEGSFPGKKHINRGFGGSQIADSIHFADRIVLPYRPRTVVLYAGDNDVTGGKSPRQVADDFREFVRTVHARLPETRIVFIAIKPSIARWKLVEKMRDANQRIAAICKSDAQLTFVDIDAPMLGADGKPREELFVDDGLHLSPAGYRVWTSLVSPHLE